MSTTLSSSMYTVSHMLVLLQILQVTLNALSTTNHIPTIYPLAYAKSKHSNHKRPHPNTSFHSPDYKRATGLYLLYPKIKTVCLTPHPLLVPHLPHLHHPPLPTHPPHHPRRPRHRPRPTRHHRTPPRRPIHPINRHAVHAQPPTRPVDKVPREVRPETFLPADDAHPFG